MKRLSVSLLVVASLVFPSLVLMIAPPAQACPEKEPETLLALYKNSDVVVSATFRGMDESVAVKADNDEYSTAQVSKHFAVTKVFKGSAKKMVTLYETKYIYPEPPAEEPPTQGAVESESHPEEGEEEEVKPLEPGDRVMLFLKHDEDSKRLELTDYRDAIKNVPASDLAVYESRVKQLGPILSAKKVDPEKIVDWLIECAEDEVTRWDGAAELSRSFSDFERQKEQAGSTESQEGEAFSVEFAGESDASYAAAMNEFHRQRLTNILMTADFRTTKKGKAKRELTAGNAELLTLVTRWADKGIADKFLAELRSLAYEPYENSQMMGVVSSVLKDQGLQKFASDYGDVVWYGDEDVIENDETSEEGSEEVVIPEVEGGSGDAAAENTAEKKEKPKRTYKQLRAELMDKFLTKADEVIARGQKAELSMAR